MGGGGWNYQNAVTIAADAAKSVALYAIQNRKGNKKTFKRTLSIYLALRIVVRLDKQ
jgi:hypothetical protein